MRGQACPARDTPVSFRAVKSHARTPPLELAIADCSFSVATQNRPDQKSCRHIEKLLIITSPESAVKLLQIVSTFAPVSFPTIPVGVSLKNSAAVNALISRCSVLSFIILSRLDDCFNSYSRHRSLICRGDERLAPPRLFTNPKHSNQNQGD